jgi:hypothetical protein
MPLEGLGHNSCGRTCLGIIYHHDITGTLLEVVLCPITLTHSYLCVDYLFIYLFYQTIKQGHLKETIKQA